MNIHRQHLLEVYQAALKSVQGDACTYELLIKQSLDEPVAVVAIGKAAESMMKGVIAALGSQLEAGLIITKSGHCGDFCQYIEEETKDHIQCLEANHPIPGKNSLLAGKAMLSFISQQPASRTMIFLISGGASSLVEVLPEGIELADLEKLNHWLLASGLDITTINNIRTRISTIKGGRLGKYLEGKKVINLLMSDVPEDVPYIIGSGLLSPNPDIQKPLPDELLKQMPGWFEKLIQQAVPAPEITDPCFNSIDTHIVARLEDAKLAAADAASAMGYKVILHSEFIHGDAFTSGQSLAKVLCDSEPAFHIWGGETTVCLPDKPGRGGRNQHLALAAAQLLDGREDCYLLSAGTDGSDGPTEDAGALVDGGTLARGRSMGYEVEKALSGADSGSFLMASNDLIRTGPTGTNVMDLVLGLKA